jgi:hypothetical protein
VTELHPQPTSQGDSIPDWQHQTRLPQCGISIRPKSAKAQPEVAHFRLMSALASCGHNAKSGFVSTVPRGDLSMCSKIRHEKQLRGKTFHRLIAPQASPGVFIIR